MPIVKDKYRGTITYHLVFKELIAAARYRGTVTYQEIANIMNLPPSGSHMGKEVGYILGEISEDEHNQGRPMLSTVAVGISGEPGPGFYALAEQLGKLGKNATKEEKIKFWKNQRDEVYKKWQKNIHTEK